MKDRNKSLKKSKEVGTRWITIGAHRSGEKDGNHSGRHVLINGKGVIVGGAVPKSWHGQEIGEAVKGADKELTNMYKGYKKDELAQIHQSYKDSHEEMKKQLHGDVNGLAKWLRDQDVESRTNNIVKRIRDIGRIHFDSNPEYKEDLQDVHPGVKKAVGTQKSKQGMGLDVMADELGMHPDDLIDYLKAASPNYYKKIEDFHEEAKRQMGHDYKNRLKDIEEMGKHVRAIQKAMEHHDQNADKEAHKIWAAFAPSAEKAIPGSQAAFDKGGVKGLMDHIAVNSPKHYEGLKTNMANKVKLKGDSVTEAEKRANEILQSHTSPLKKNEDETYYPSDRYTYKTNEKDPIYIPVNRIQTPFQTEEATNPDKVRENVKRMKAGESLQPIIIGYRNHVLHDGHHRLEAAKKMGYTHVPCVVGGRNERRVKAAEKRYRRMWKSDKTVIENGRVLIKSKLSPKLKSLVARGDAHWVTIKEGPLAGRHILIGGPRPTAGERSKGPILAGHGIPPHVIQKITGATHAEHLETEPHRETPPEGTQERWSWWNDKIKKGNFTADEVREHFKWATSNKDKLHAMYMEQINNDPKLKRKRNNTKNEIAQRAYDRHIQKLGYAASDSLQYNPFSDNGLEEGVKRVVDNLTDEDIQKHWGEKRAEFAAKQKAIENPETLQELRQKKMSVGEDRMTDAEREKLDELEALEAKKRNAQPETKTVAPTTSNVGGFDVTQTKHTKTGADLWVAKPKNRLDRDEFNELHNKVKAIGGYYSKYTKGFTFNEDPGEKLNGLLSGGAEVENHKATEDYKQNKAQSVADKLRSVADNMQTQIDNKLADRLTNTARRASMAASAEADADRMKHIQKVMRNIADGIESGEATHLDGVTSRTHVETLENILKRAHWENDRKNGVGYEKSRQTQPNKDDIKDLEYPKPYANLTSLRYLMEGIEGKPGTKRAVQYLQRHMDAARRQDQHSFEFEHGSRAYDEIQKLVNIGKNDPKAKYYADSVNDGLIQSKRLQTMGIENSQQLRAALREYMNYRGNSGISEEEANRRKLRDMEQQSTRQNIAGFFPTPKTLANRMVEEADIKPGMKVLEPSAGKGNIADAIKEEHPQAHLDTVEYNNGLAEILRHKGHNVVGDDFLQHKGEYDRIVMNPPFENGQDIDHVRHAFNMLKPGGKLVAIMSESPFFSSRSKASEFREWLDHNGGHSEKLPEGSFKDSERSTGVNTRLVVIEKPRNAHKSMITKDGRLLIKKKQKTITMYHGTWGKIDKFTKREIKDYNTIGSWFTSDPKTAQDLYGPNLYEAHVELKKPYPAETDDFDRFFFNEKLAEKYLNGKDLNNPDRDVMTKLLNNKKYMTDFKRDLEKRGYDAIMFKNSTIDKEPDGSEGRHTVYIVFHPENQVKDSRLVDRKTKTKKHAFTSKGRVLVKRR